MTDPALIRQYGLSDPNPFFTQLSRLPFLNNVIIRCWHWFLLTLCLAADLAAMLGTLPLIACCTDCRTATCITKICSSLPLESLSCCAAHTSIHQA